MDQQALPVNRTNILRYDFQIQACEDAPGKVFNIGCNEDPAELQKRFGDRIVNCDMEAWDRHMDRPNRVDVVFNALERPWPIPYGSLVLLGDILEHFTPQAIISTLDEAALHAPMVAVTVPEDTRIDETHQTEVWGVHEYNLHTTIVTEVLLRELLDSAGWKVRTFLTGPWGFDNIQGHCVLAGR